MGGSMLGRHLTFEPRVELARSLRREHGDRLHAMMDLSDGLSLDLARMCEASGVGAELDEEALLAHAADEARRAADNDGRPLIDHMLNDGEDFELLCAIAAPEGESAAGAAAGEDESWARRSTT